MRAFNSVFFASASQLVASLHNQSSRAMDTCFCRSLELLRGLCSLGWMEYHQALYLSLPSDFFKDLVVSLSSMTLS